VAARVRRPEPLQDDEVEEVVDIEDYEEEEEYEEERPHRRPTRRPRYEEEEEYEEERPRRRAAGRLPRWQLRSVALYQKLLLVGLLLQVLALIGWLVLPDSLSLVVWLTLVPVGLATTVFAFLLSMRVFGTGLGVLMGMLTLLPAVGLIALVVINVKATGVLGAHGYQVGLLGVPLSEFSD
jgi:hypothetical protein